MRRRRGIVRSRRRRVKEAPLVRGAIGTCYCCGRKSFLRRVSFFRSKDELAGMWTATKTLVKGIVESIFRQRPFLPYDKIGCVNCGTHKKSVVWVGATMDTVDGPYCEKCARDRAKRKFEDEFGRADYEAVEINVRQRFGSVEQMYSILGHVKAALDGPEAFSGAKPPTPVAPASDSGLLF